MRDRDTLPSDTDRSQQEGAPGWTRRRFLTASAVAGTGVLLGAPNLARANALRTSALPGRLGAAAPGQELPREQTLILNNPEGAAANPGWFNIWVNGGGGTSTGLHQLMMDTLWYIDPDAGVDGVVIQNSLATGPAQYNADFSEMTVPLRDGIYWSDGEKFTAKDVVFTVETQMNTPGMNWSGAVLDPGRERRRSGRPDRPFRAPEAQLEVPFDLLGALERGVDHARAHLLRCRRRAVVRLQPSGRSRAVHPAQLRPERDLVHLGEARGLGPHGDRRLR